MKYLIVLATLASLQNFSAANIPPVIFNYLLDNKANCSEEDVIGKWEFTNHSTNDILPILQTQRMGPYGQEHDPPLEFFANYTNSPDFTPPPPDPDDYVDEFCPYSYDAFSNWELVNGERLVHRYGHYECVLGREGIDVRLDLFLDESCSVMSGEVSIGSFVPVAVSGNFVVSAKKMNKSALCLYEVKNQLNIINYTGFTVNVIYRSRREKRYFKLFNESKSLFLINSVT